MNSLNNNINTDDNDSVNELLDLKLIYRIIQREKKLIFIITFVSTILSVFITGNLKNIYEGKFRIVVRKELETSLESRLLNLNASPLASTQELILSSPSVLNPVFNSVKEAYKKRGDEIEYLSYENWFKTKLKIKFIDQSDVLQIRFVDQDKDLILRTLKNISKSYQEYSRRDRNRNLKITIDFLEKEQKKLKLITDNAISNLNKFSIDNGLGDIDGFVDIESNDSLSKVLFGENDSKSVNSGSSRSGQRFQNQFKMLELYESKYTDLSSRLKPNSSTLKELEVKIKNLKSSLKRPNEILLKFRELKRFAEKNESTLINLENQLINYKLEFARQLEPWELISIPEVSSDRVSPKRKLPILSTIIISFVLSSIIAFMKEKKSNYIFEFIPLKKRIKAKYLYTLSPKQKKINRNIVSGILRNNLKKDEKVGIINFYHNLAESNDTFFLENTKNYINLNIEDENFGEDFNFIIILITSSKKYIKDINLLNNYIKIYEDKILGWFYIDEYE